MREDMLIKLNNTRN